MVCGLYFNSESSCLWLVATAVDGLGLDLGTAHPLAGEQGSLPRRESFGVLGKVFLTSKGTGRGGSFLFFLHCFLHFLHFCPLQSTGLKIRTTDALFRAGSTNPIGALRMAEWEDGKMCGVLMVLFSTGLYSTWDPLSSSTRHTISWNYKWLFCLGHFESITCSWKHLNWWLM